MSKVYNLSPKSLDDVVDLYHKGVITRLEAMGLFVGAAADIDDVDLLKAQMKGRLLEPLNEYAERTPEERATWQAWRKSEKDSMTKPVRRVEGTTSFLALLQEHIHRCSVDDTIEIMGGTFEGADYEARRARYRKGVALLRRSLSSQGEP